jgi:hypothetical protein
MPHAETYETQHTQVEVLHSDTRIPRFMAWLATDMMTWGPW